MANPTLYNVDTIIQGVNGFGTQFPVHKYSATLAASTDTTLAVPDSSAIGAINATKTPRFLAVFSYHSGRNVWVSINATAAVPAGGTFAAVSSELNPSAKVVKATDTIHAICATAATDVGVTFYALPEA